MKILWFAPSDMLMEPVVCGLQNLDLHEVCVVRYDQLQLPVDRPMLDAAHQLKPDVILYTGQNGGRFKPGYHSLRWLRQYAPTVLLCHDGSDSSWEPLIHLYHDKDVFTSIVNIDGNSNWECGSNDLTLLTPVDPTLYPANPKPLAERPIDFGFAGGYSSPSRRDIVEYLQREAGLVVPPRDERYGSYNRYVDFLSNTKVVLNVPFSGSDNATQVKGRVIEAGLAGCCLLEKKGGATETWFDRYFHFLPYKHKEDAAKEALRYPNEYLAGAQMHADALRYEVLTNHSPSVFWPKVFAKCGF